MPRPTTARPATARLSGVLFAWALTGLAGTSEATAQASSGAQAPLSSEATPYPASPGAYRVFTGDGAPSSLDAVVGTARAAEVLFLGEMHDDRVGHAVQHEIFGALIGTNVEREVVLSLEMFERDVQYVVDEYLAGLISEAHLLRSGRPWPFYEEDYRPLLEAARARGLSVIAANAPRRYVNMVTRGSPSALDALSEQAKTTLPPLPYAPPSAEYHARFDAEMASHGSAEPDTATGPSYGVYAQALWDAGMAYSISESLVRDPDALVVHLVGSFHVSWGLGLPEHLARYRPGTRMVTVVMWPTKERSALPDSLRGLADFVVLTDSAHVRPRPEMDGATASNQASERIVSLGASTTEILYALGLGGQLVGRDAASLHPPEAEALPNVGYGASLNPEGILALRPTVVVGVGGGARARLFDQLRAIGVRVAEVPDVPTADGVRVKIRAVARAVDREAAGEALVASFDRDLALLEEKVAARSGNPVRALFLYLRGRQATYVCGSGSAAGHMLELAGAADAAVGLEGCPAMTAEAVVASSPDAIVVYTRGLESVGGIEGLLTLPAVAQTPAGRARRVVALDDLYLGSFGPRAARAALDLHRGLYEATGVFVEDGGR